MSLNIGSNFVFTWDAQKQFILAKGESQICAGESDFIK